MRNSTITMEFNKATNMWEVMREGRIVRAADSYTIALYMLKSEQENEAHELDMKV